MQKPVHSLDTSAIGFAQETSTELWDDDRWECDRCGGEGYILACDGDGSDWGEDVYCGPLDEEIKCRACNGTGRLK